jgi:hypothetical protein
MDPCCRVQRSHRPRGAPGPPSSSAFPPRHPRSCESSRLYRLGRATISRDGRLTDPDHVLHPSGPIAECHPLGHLPRRNPPPASRPEGRAPARCADGSVEEAVRGERGPLDAEHPSVLLREYNLLCRSVLRPGGSPLLASHIAEPTLLHSHPLRS